MKTLLTIMVAIFSLAVAAQTEKKSVVIGSMTSKPNAILIVNPQNSDQGVLLPQLSTGQRMSLKPSSPTEDGLIVFDTNQKSYFYWSDGKWVRLYGDNGKESYYSIDPVNFLELKPNNEIRHNNLVVFETDNTFVTASRNGLGEKFIAPVNLPHRADIIEFTVYYMDNDDDNLKVILVRKDHSGNTEQIVSWESSGASAVVQNQSFNNFSGLGEVDLENYTYRVLVEFDIDDGDDVYEPSEARQRLYGIRLKYRP